MKETSLFSLWGLVRSFASDFPSALKPIHLGVERLLLKHLYASIGFEASGDEVGLLSDYFGSHRERPSQLYRGNCLLTCVVDNSDMGDPLTWSLSIDGVECPISCLSFVRFYDRFDIKVTCPFRLSKLHLSSDLIAQVLEKVEGGSFVLHTSGC